MALLDVLVPSLLANIAVGLSFFDVSVIRARVFAELPDTLLTRDDNRDLLRAGDELTRLPQLSLSQREKIAELCQELRRSAGFSRERREQIVQLCAGASLLTAFAANVAVIIATAVFTLLSVSHPYRLTANLLVVLCLVLVIGQIWYSLSRLPLSAVEEYHLSLPATRGDRGPTWGLLLRAELVVLNCLLFIELAVSQPG